MARPAARSRTPFPRNVRRWLCPHSVDDEPDETYLIAIVKNWHIEEHDSTEPCSQAIIPVTGSSLRTPGRILPVGLAAVSLLLAAIWMTMSWSPSCDPQEAETALAHSADLGIHGANRPPSLSNLLWVHVGPRWHALPLADKRTLDAVVRCAARTIDDRGQPTWQAAYYDQRTGKMVALTSRRYGFRLKTVE